MSDALALIVFDVDGTLVDSQGHILGAMTAAFQAAGQEPPTREAVLSIVGLSLPQAMARLAPQLTDAAQATLVQSYKDNFAQMRLSGQGASPLYPGTAQMLAQLKARQDILMGVATGKSARGLEAMIAAHALEQSFVTRQVADHHPSKPHPSMLLTAMAEAGVEAARTVMVGDTTFDMQMAQAAGVPFIAVDWGYHPASSLSGAHACLSDWDGLMPALEQILGITS